jgi:hypothetical protein
MSWQYIITAPIYRRTSISHPVASKKSIYEATPLAERTPRGIGGFDQHDGRVTGLHYFADALLAHAALEGAKRKTWDRGNRQCKRQFR